MALFQFTGNWEFNFTFAAFKGFQSRQGYYGSISSDEKSDGTVKVSIFDELNDGFEPSESQINALNFLIENPETIKSSLIDALEQHVPSLIEYYGEGDEYLPVFSTKEELANFFGVANVFVFLEEKDNFSYIGLECGCTWDDEHGLGFLLHKNRVFHIGAADASFDIWEVSKDNGTFEKKQKIYEDNQKNPTQLPKPKKYSPSEKYNNLKPSQIEANNMFEFRLIERSYNEDFIFLVEKGEIDVNTRTPHLNMSYLSRAAQFDNEVLVTFILSQNPKDITYAIHQTSNIKVIEQLLNKGADVNEKNEWGLTKLKVVQNGLEWAQKNNDDTLINKLKALSQWLISVGAKE
jgi:hypothetical protein